MQWEYDSWNLESREQPLRTQAVAEAQMSLPPQSEGALRFLLGQARVEEASARVGQGQAEITGTVAFTVIYETAAGITAMESRSSFTHSVPLPQAEPGQRVVLSCEALEAQVRWMNERQCRVECPLEMMLTLFSLRRSSYVSGVQEPGVETRSLPLEGAWVSGSSRRVFTLEEDVELESSLPEAGELLLCQGSVELTALTQQAGQVSADGAVMLELLYRTAQPQSVALARLRLPFSQQWDASELEAGSTLVGEGRVEECRMRLFETVTGEKRVLALAVQVGLWVQGYTRQRGEMLEDAYSAAEEIELEKELWRIPALPVQTAQTVPVSAILPLEDGSPQPQRMLETLARAVTDGAEAGEGRCKLTGRLLIHGLYLNPEGQVSALSRAVPFETGVSCEGMLPGDWTQVMLRPLRCTVRLNGQGALELEAEVEAGILWRPVREQPVTTEAESEPWDEELPSGLALVVAQREEDNWSMAKRCRIPEAVLLRDNPELAQRQVRAGECLVVERI